MSTEPTPSHVLTVVREPRGKFIGYGLYPFGENLLFQRPSAIGRVEGREIDVWIEWMSDIGHEHIATGISQILLSADDIVAFKMRWL